MSEQITLTLPSEVFRQAEALARRAGRPVGDLLAETVELSLRPLGAAPDEPPPDAWSDEEVLAGADQQMPAAEDQRLSELLQRQQAGPLTSTERSDLNGLMALYQRLLLRKAQALREAVRRGLRGPVEP
jgi:hypothetical protein